MKTSQLVQSVAESATLRINDRATRLAAEGKPVVHLGIGEPKNRAPASAVHGVERLLAEGMLKYTPASGLPSLRASIARHTSSSYGFAVEADNVLVANGSKQALYNLLVAVVDPNDEVVFPAPYWVSYPEMVKLVRGIPVPVAPPAGTLQPDPDAMLAALNDRTRVVILNTPNNPSGMVYSEDFVAEMVRTCERRGIYLVMDDIYRQLVFDGPAPSAYALTDRDRETTHVVVVNGISKVYGLTGLRLGWAIAPTPLIAAMNTVQGQTTSNASVLSQAAAEAALNGDQSVVDELVEHLRHNRRAMLDGLAGVEGVRVDAPGGGLYCFPDFSAVDPDSVRLSELLLERAWVATVPGIEFGTQGYLRLGFAGRLEDVLEGVRRIRWAVDAGQPAEIEIGDLQLVRDWL